MKKSNILIAVFAVLAAASVAKAENLEVSFDGQKGLQPQSMHDIFAAAHEISAPESGTTDKMAPANVSPKMKGLSPENGKMLYALLAERHSLAVDAELAADIRDGKAAVLYNKEKAYVTKTMGDDTRMVKFESRDPEMLAMIIKASRKFPESRWDNPDGVGSGVGNKLCAEYTTTEQCQNRKVCRVVTAAGGSYGGVAGAILGAFAGEYVCEWVPECSTIQTCIRWE